MKAGKATEAEAQPVAKRPRGRPRKPRNNTADTAILLSDSDREDEDAADKQVPQKDKKRPWTKVESPAPSPALKRAVSTRASALPPPAAVSAAQTEIDRLQQQLASEKSMRADAEAAKADLQKILEEKDASWAAEMAAQTMPLQLQLQRTAKEKRDLDARCTTLEARLQEALDKDQQRQTSVIEPQPTAPNKEEVEAELREKDAVISNQAAEVERLKGVEVARTKDLSEACQKVKTLTETQKGLTARHGAATKLIQEHETRIQHLTHALSTTMNFPTSAGEARTTVNNTLAQANMRIALAERQAKGAREMAADLQRKLVASTEERATLEKRLAATEGKLAEAEGHLMRAKQPMVAGNKAVGSVITQAPGHEQTAPTQAQVIIHNLRHGQSIMAEERKASLLEIKRLQDLVAGLEKEKLQGTAANDEKNLLLQQLDEAKAQVSALQSCKQKWEEASKTVAGEMASLRQRCDEKTKQVEELKHDKERHMAAVAHFRNQHRLALQGCEARDQALASAQQEKDDLAQKHQSAVDQLSALRAEIAQAGPSLAAKSEEVRALKEKMEKGKVAFAADIQRMVIKLRDKAQQLDAKDREVRGLQMTVDNLRDVLTKLESGSTACMTKLSQRNAEVSQYQQAMAQQQTQIHSLQQAVAALTAERTRLNHELAAGRDKLDQTDSQFAQVLADKASRVTKEDELEMLRNQLSIAEAEIEHLKKEIAARVAETDTLKTQLASPPDTTTTPPEDSHTPTSKNTDNPNEADTPPPTLASLLADKAAYLQTITDLQARIQELTAQPPTTTTTAPDADADADADATSSTPTNTSTSPPDDQSSDIESVESLQARIAQLTRTNSSLERERDEQAEEAEALKARVVRVEEHTAALREKLGRREGCLERVRGYVSALSGVVGEGESGGAEVC